MNTKHILALMCAFTVAVAVAAPLTLGRRAPMKFGKSDKFMLKSELYGATNIGPKAGTVTSGDWTWVTTITTNDVGQVTKVANGTKKDGTKKTVYYVWNDCEVPLKYRELLATLDDESKGNLLSFPGEYWTDVPSEKEVRPVEFADGVTDDGVTEEIHEIKARW